MHPDTSLTPVNREAAKMFAKGVSHDNGARIVRKHWSAPPAMIPLPKLSPDLIGAKFGRMEVVGFLADSTKEYVVRCLCGDYETRRARAIRNPENFGDRCTVCQKDAHIKRHDAQGNRKINIDVRTI